MAAVEKYKIPRAQIDVEAMAQRIYLYLRIGSEDTEYLCQHPAERDQKIAELYASPACKPSFWPTDMIGDDPSPEQVDEYLSQANAQIDALTPPKSLDDRVIRSHVTAAALVMYQQYKWAHGLRGHRDLQRQVLIRYNALMDEWMRNEFPRLFPESVAKATRNQATSTTPTSRAPLSPPITSHTARAKAITASDINEYLYSPHTLLRKQFKHSPPSDQDQEYKGLWEVESYTARVRDDRVDHEFQIILEACDGATIPMDREEVQFLLQYSNVVS
ncbi:hypothetical protein BV20DRAFT_1125244 [Pilatotrama ljubarskyi]|nr:hypothetical protein BV20DRAFT_1125244 [Pilatotrama ljubarskyi]